MWGALLGGLISGGFSLFGADKQADAAQEASLLQQMMLGKAAKNLNKDYQSVIDDIADNPTGYAGSRVEAALYNPVDIAQSQRSSVQGNLGNLDLINQLVSGANRATLSNDIERINQFDPNALSTIGNLGGMANLLSSGRLPTDAIQDIISNSSSRFAANGTPGGGQAATLRDLGMNSIDAANRGASLFSQLMSSVEQISPMSRQMAAGQFMINPGQALQTDLQQAQLDQQSRQNYNNLAAAPDPALNLMAQLRLQKANNTASIRAGGAQLVQPNMTPYASIYGQIGNSIGQAFTGLFGGGMGGGGGYSSGFGASSFNANALNYNMNLPTGAAPKAYIV